MLVLPEVRCKEPSPRSEKQSLGTTRQRFLCCSPAAFLRLDKTSYSQSSPGGPQAPPTLNFPDRPSHCYPGNGLAGSKAARATSRCILGVVVRSQKAQAQPWRRGMGRRGAHPGAEPHGDCSFSWITHIKGVRKSDAVPRLLISEGKGISRHECLWLRETWFGNGVGRPPFSSKSEMNWGSPQMERVGRRTDPVICKREYGTTRGCSGVREGRRPRDSGKGQTAVFTSWIRIFFRNFGLFKNDTKKLRIWHAV